MLFSFKPISLKFFIVFPNKNSFSVSLIIRKLSLIYFPIKPFISSKSLHYIIFPISWISIFVCPSISSLIIVQILIIYCRPIILNILIHHSIDKFLGLIFFRFYKVLNILMNQAIFIHLYKKYHNLPICLISNILYILFHFYEHIFHNHRLYHFSINLNIYHHSHE